MVSAVQVDKIGSEVKYVAKMSKRRDLAKYSHTKAEPHRMYRLELFSKERIKGQGQALIALKLEAPIPRKLQGKRFSFRWFFPDAVKIYPAEQEDFTEIICSEYIVVKVVNTNSTDATIESDEIAGFIIFD